MSKYILDTRLSNAQYIICMEAIRQDVIEPSDLNEGRRTIAEQWAFWNNQPPLAAFPSPFAPHIKKGFANHAIDCNSFNGASQRLLHFYQSYNIPVAFNVRGEPWHMDVLSHLQVLIVAKKLRKKRDAEVWHIGERGKPVKFLKYQLHVIHDRSNKGYFEPDMPRPPEGWGMVFGQGLEAAVKRFQSDHDLKADGRVGRLTDAKIDRAYGRAQARRKSVSSRGRAQARKMDYEKGRTL